MRFIYFVDGIAAVTGRINLELHGEMVCNTELNHSETVIHRTPLCVRLQSNHVIIDTTGYVS